MRVKTRRVLDAIAAGEALTPDERYPSIWCDEEGNVWSYQTCISTIHHTMLLLNMSDYSRTTGAHQHTLSHALLREVQKQNDKVKYVGTFTMLPFEVKPADLVSLWVNGHLSPRWNRENEHGESTYYTPKGCRVEGGHVYAIFDGEEWKEVGKVNGMEIAL